MEAPALIPKAEANYRKDSEGTPCATCANFIAPDACATVEGTISESGTCDLYAMQEAAGQAPDPEALMAQLFGGGGGGF